MASPETQKAFDLVREISRNLGRQKTVWGMRRAYEEAMAQFAVPEGVDYQPVGVGTRRGEWVIPAGADDRAILYFHGGGYVICSIDTHREMVSRIALAAGARALLVDYRLAPEHPFPAAVEDAVAAYRWLLGQGLSPSRLALAGDSAGGGLVAAALVAIRYLGLPLPAAGVCISPWADMTLSGASWEANAKRDPIVVRPALEQLARWYLAGADPRTPLASPIFADLRGLPPLLVQVGTAETLLDDARALAEKARRDGVAVVLEEWEDMPHVWHFFGSFLPEARQAIQRIGEFLRERMA
nr:monoterpene epsilon-lactone hydrolase [uncultured bacterium]